MIAQKGRLPADGIVEWGIDGRLNREHAFELNIPFFV